MATNTNIPGVVSTDPTAGLATEDNRGIYRADPGGRSDIDTAAHAQAVDAVRTMFGGNVVMRQPVGMSMAPIDRHGTRGHTTTGIPYAISGTADLVEIDVGERLMAFSDPVRAILGTGVHTSQKVIIKRQYATGGGASIVPERAPARTIGLAEDVKEVVLTRYGADIEWNLNLLNRPADFSKEMNIKVNAQKESLQMELVKIAYDTLMTEGTSLISALVSSSPTHTTNPRLAQINAERIYVSSVFGAMQRFSYPVHNLIAAAKYATNFTISQADKTVMIVPYGMPELHKYSKQENMVSYIHGVQHGDPLTAEVTGGAVDTATNTTVYVHRPPMSYMHGAANPTSEGSMLQTEVTFATFYFGGVEGGQVYDHIKRSLVPMEDGFNIRVYKATMHSAILGIPNGASQGTGEMLIGYPSTMVGSDVSTETGRMRLRMYLGCALYRPENVMILPDVGWGGLSSITPCPVEGLDPGDNVRSSYVIHKGTRGGDELGNTFELRDVDGPTDGDDFLAQANYAAVVAGAFDCLDELNGSTIYQAATFDAQGNQLLHNNGHLGCLDSPECGDRVFGNFVYSKTPSAV
jgi:hypothetical protein